MALLHPASKWSYLLVTLFLVLAATHARSEEPAANDNEKVEDLELLKTAVQRLEEIDDVSRLEPTELDRLVTPILDAASALICDLPPEVSIRPYLEALIAAKEAELIAYQKWQKDKSKHTEQSRYTLSARGIDLCYYDLADTPAERNALARLRWLYRETLWAYLDWQRWVPGSSIAETLSQHLSVAPALSDDAANYRSNLQLISLGSWTYSHPEGKTDAIRPTIAKALSQHIPVDPETSDNPHVTPVSMKQLSGFLIYNQLEPILKVIGFRQQMKSADVGVRHAAAWDLLNVLFPIDTARYRPVIDWDGIDAKAALEMINHYDDDSRLREELDGWIGFPFTEHNASQLLVFPDATLAFVKQIPQLLPERLADLARDGNFSRETMRSFSSPSLGASALLLHRLRELTPEERWRASHAYLIEQLSGPVEEEMDRLAAADEAPDPWEDGSAVVEPLHFDEETWQWGELVGVFRDDDPGQRLPLMLVFTDQRVGQEIAYERPMRSSWWTLARTTDSGGEIEKLGAFELTVGGELWERANVAGNGRRVVITQPDQVTVLDAEGDQHWPAVDERGKGYKILEVFGVGNDFLVYGNGFVARLDFDRQVLQPLIDGHHPAFHPWSPAPRRHKILSKLELS